MIVGGTMAFGWGVAAGETTAAYLRQLVEAALAEPATPRIVTAVNLGVEGMRMRDYPARINRFRYLRPDVICLYVDLTDPTVRDTLPSQRSTVTALTGYVPMLPLVLDEKGAIVSGRGSTWRGALTRSAGRTLAAVDRWAYDLAADAEPADADRQASLARAIDTALEAAWGVTVVLPTPLTNRQGREHSWMRAYVDTRAATDPRMRVVDLSLQPRLAAVELRLDEAHFGAGGQALAAAAILPAALDLIATRAPR